MKTTCNDLQVRRCRSPTGFVSDESTRLPPANIFAAPILSLSIIFRQSLRVSDGRDQAQHLIGALFVEQLPLRSRRRHCHLRRQNFQGNYYRPKDYSYLA
jgi:hypothetical protein